eukprot:3835803-Prymnesium_polylepis.2
MTTGGQPMCAWPLWALAALTNVVLPSTSPDPVVTPCASWMWPLTTSRGRSRSTCSNSNEHPNPPSTKPATGPCVIRISMVPGRFVARAPRAA